MDTLVIDLAEQPVRRAPWYRAIVQVVVDRDAEVVKSYPERFIHTPRPLHYNRTCLACEGDAGRKRNCLSCGGLGKVVDLSRMMPTCEQLSEDRWRVNMPSVIQLVALVPRQRGIRFSRNNVYARDYGKCQYCPRHVGLGSFTLDHVVPRAQGGRTSWTNVVVACGPCNQRKGARTPAQAGMELLSQPTRPKFLPASPRAKISYNSGMPEAWEGYLRDAVYWDGELEHDE